jgi:hypothetical protein
VTEPACGCPSYVRCSGLRPTLCFTALFVFICYFYIKTSSVPGFLFQLVARIPYETGAVYKAMLQIIIIITIIIAVIHKAITVQRHGEKLIIQMVCYVTLFGFHNMNIMTVKIVWCFLQGTQFNFRVYKVSKKTEFYGDIYLQEYCNDNMVALFHCILF